MRAPRNNSKSKGFEEAGSGVLTLASVLTKGFYPRERENGLRNHDRGGGEHAHTVIEALPYWTLT